MYLFLSAIAQRFDLQFPTARAEDYECSSDQYAIGTESMGRLAAVATDRKV